MHQRASCRFCAQPAVAPDGGPDAGVAGWLAAAGILMLLILAVSWLSAAIGLVTKSAEAANGFTFLPMFLSLIRCAGIVLAAVALTIGWTLRGQHW